MAELVGSSEELEAFTRLSPAERRPTPALRGILAETAVYGCIRYEWRLLRPLVAFYLEKVLADYEAEQAVEMGPQRPLPGGEAPAELRARLLGLLDAQFPEEAPFTLQRLAELLLEPHRHYSRLEKLALALEKLLNVTSTLPPSADPPPPRRLQDLPPVNCNPRNPTAGPSAEDGRPSKQRPGAHGSGPAGGEAGFGLASSAVASSSHEPHSTRQGTPELEEALGHLNEAGAAARAAPASPLQEGSPGAAAQPPHEQAAPMQTDQPDGRPGGA